MIVTPHLTLAIAHGAWECAVNGLGVVGRLGVL